MRPSLCSVLLRFGHVGKLRIRKDIFVRESRKLVAEGQVVNSWLSERYVKLARCFFASAIKNVSRMPVYPVRILTLFGNHGLNVIPSPARSVETACHPDVAHFRRVDDESFLNVTSSLNDKLTGQ